MNTISLDHLIPSPWHPLTISGGGSLLAVSWSCPEGCPARCCLDRVLLDSHGDLPEPLRGLPAGSYRLRAGRRGLEVRHAEAAR